MYKDITEIYHLLDAKIQDRAFFGTHITSFAVPPGVREIGNYSFAECSQLTTFTMPNTVTLLGQNVFTECTNLVSVTLSNALTEIPCDTFMECSSLRFVHIPDSVARIGPCAFNECSALKAVRFPRKLKSIEWGCFSNCKSLETIYLPDSVEKLDCHAFEGCDRVGVISIPNTIHLVGDQALLCGKHTILYRRHHTVELGVEPEPLDCEFDFDEEEMVNTETVNIFNSFLLILSQVCETHNIDDGVCIIVDHICPYLAI